MHELSLAYNLVEIAEEAARSAGAPPARVEAVRLRLGAQAGVVAEALLFAFDVAAQGTPLEGAALRVEPVAAAIYCTECGAERELDEPRLLACPLCGAPASRLIRGREMEIVALELRD